MANKENLQKQRTLCGFILVFGLFFSCASLPEQAGSAVQTGSSVWTVSKNGSTMFLGGSIHVLRSGDFPLPEEFDRAFEQASMLVLEADVERMADPNVAQYLMTRMFLPGDKSLESILDSKTYAMLETKCEGYGIPMASLAGIKPSMVITMLTVLEMQNSGFVQEGVDMYYLGKAMKAEMPIGFLETVEAQIDLIVAMGDGYENDYVKYSLEDLNNTENELAAIVAGWKEGDAANTEETLAEMKAQWPVLYRAMLTDRNEAWLPRLEEYLAGSRIAFVIVGLAHLHGPDGLLRRLEDSGSIVEKFR